MLKRNQTIGEVDVDKFIKGQFKVKETYETKLLQAKLES